MYHFTQFRRSVSGVLSAAILTTAVSAYEPPLSVRAADPDYSQALALSLYFYDANQCGSGITDGPLTWRGDCHTYDAKVNLSDAVGLSSGESEAVKQANGNSAIIDASGGYHDAGDHIKFSVTIGFACTSLAWSYFSYPDAFAKAECTDHLKYILRNMCDYLMKVTFLDGSGNVIAYVDQVASEGEDHSVWTAPEDQTMKRTVFFASPSTPIADSAGEMAAALASTSLAFKNDDPAYAANCLKYAKALSAFGEKYPSYKATGRGGMYDGSSSLKDDLAWGKLWCDLADNDGKLPDGYTPPVTLTGDKSFSNGDYDGWLYCWGKVYGGYSSLLAELGFDGDRYKNEVKLEVNGTGNGKFTNSTYAANWGWGSARYNCALQCEAWRSGDAALQAAAKYQMDCILQSSTAFQSYLVGYGSSYPLHYHHRAANTGNCNSAEDTAAESVLYGALLGGPNENGGYEDNKNTYGCTEPALDYNGCFVLAITPLVSRAADANANGTKATIKNAAEINENFDFGGKTVPEVTTTTTSATTTTTTTTTSTETTLPSAAPMLGDVDDNGKVDILDGVLLARLVGDDSTLKREDITDRGKLNADVTQDGRVQINDLDKLMRVFAKYDTLPTAG